MRAMVLLAMLLAAACARVVPTVTTPAIDRSAELSRAAALVETGCLDCLIEADGLYDALRHDPDLGPVPRSRAEVP